MLALLYNCLILTYKTVIGSNFRRFLKFKDGFYVLVTFFYPKMSPALQNQQQRRKRQRSTEDESDNEAEQSQLDLSDEEGGLRVDDIYIPPPPKQVNTVNGAGTRLIITGIDNNFFKSYAEHQKLGPFHKVRMIFCTVRGVTCFVVVLQCHYRSQWERQVQRYRFHAICVWISSQQDTIEEIVCFIAQLGKL